MRVRVRSVATSSVHNKEMYVLALDQKDPQHDNASILQTLGEHFFITKQDAYTIGQDPTDQLRELGYTQGTGMTVNPNDLALFVVAEGPRFDGLIDKVKQNSKQV